MSATQYKRHRRFLHARNHFRYCKPRFDITAHGIEQEQQPVSASRVRQLLSEGREEAIGNLVPPTTLAYLREKGFLRKEDTL